MKRLFTVLIISVILMVPMYATADSSGDARTSLITGNVYLMASDTNNQWQTVSINMPVMQGDTYWISQGARAEIQFYSNSFLRADGDTEFQVTNLDSGSTSVTISLHRGRVYVDYKNSVRGPFFEVDTPMVSLSTNQDAQFDININEGDIIEVSVVAGSVNANSASGSTTINAGNMVSFSNSGIAEVASYIPDDAWMQWNASRNYLVTQNSRSVVYLPPSLSNYGYELDNNGNWVYVATYGYVWVPIITTPNWAPFSVGRWVWIGGNYVWVSYESWGWVPYHYGRWAFRPGIGWFWVPPQWNQVFWCPGAVAWMYTPTYVSWVPLAPGETYYGYGYYGPQSVNLRYGNAPIVHRQVIYANARVTNAVTIVSRQTFASGNAYRKLKIPENPFMKAKYTYIQKPPEKIVTQPGHQFRQIASPTPANSGNRMFNQPKQPQRGFRLVTPPQTPNIPNNAIAHQQPVQQFRQINNVRAPQLKPQKQFGQVAQSQTQYRPFNTFSRSQQQFGQDIQPQTQFNNFSQPQVPATGTQYQKSWNRGSSGTFDNRSNNVQFFR